MGRICTSNFDSSKLDATLFPYEYYYTYKQSIPNAVLT